MSQEVIYQTKRQLQSFSNHIDRVPVLRKFVKVLGKVHSGPTHDKPRVWRTLGQSGLFALITTLISKPSGDLWWFGEVLDIGLEIIRTSLMIGFKSISPPELETIRSPISMIFRLSVMPTLEKLEAAGPPLNELVSPLRRSAVLLLGHWKMIFMGGELFAQYFDGNDLLRLVLAVLFGEEILPTELGQTTRDSLCASIIEAFQYDVAGTRYSAIEDAQKRYTCDAIASRCVGICAQTYEEGKFPIGLLEMLALLHHVDLRPMHHAFARHGVYGAILQTQWATLKSRDTTYVEQKSPDMFGLFILTRMFATLRRTETYLSNIATAVVSKKDDLILFLGRAILTPKSSHLISDDEHIREIEDAFRLWGEVIASVCRSDPGFKAGLCQLQWSHVFRGLLVLQRCESTILDANTHSSDFGNDFAIRVWRSIGRQLQIVESAPPETAETMRRERIQTGCSWMMCPLHLVGNELGTAKWEMLRCSGCHEMNYCGSSCQRRHWQAGHQAKCLPHHTSTSM